MGDLGGLDFVLVMVGQIILSNYQEFNYYAYLITILFVQST